MGKEILSNLKNWEDLGRMNRRGARTTGGHLTGSGPAPPRQRDDARADVARSASPAGPHSAAPRLARRNHIWFRAVFRCVHGPGTPCEGDPHPSLLPRLSPRPARSGAPLVATEFDLARPDAARAEPRRGRARVRSLRALAALADSPLGHGLASPSPKFDERPRPTSARYSHLAVSVIAVAVVRAAKNAGRRHKANTEHDGRGGGGDGDV